MVFKFIIISEEVDNFLREIEIDSEATFLELQTAILDSVGYTKDQMTSFFLCNDDWGRETEITLIEMDCSSDVDIYLMEKTRLEDLIEEEKQKLAFVFDYMTDRCLFMELQSIVPGEHLKKAKCVTSKGEAPTQMLPLEEFENQHSSASTLLMDDDFYGDSEYDMDEIDKDGFESIGDTGGENPYDDF